MNDSWRLENRPILSFEIAPNDSLLHRFQDETLRPILKMQHKHFEILIRKCLPHLETIKLIEERRNFCQHFLNKNPLVMHQLLGMVIGLFTEKEINFYIENTTEINKRIKIMLINRMTDFLVNDQILNEPE